MSQKNEALQTPLSLPMLDELLTGPWPSFVKDLKAWSEKKPVVAELLNQLEESYQNRWNYWQGKIINVPGYGGGVIARVSDKADKYPGLANFHTVRIIEPSGWVYSTAALRSLADASEKHGAGIIQLHGMTGDILLLGFDDKGSMAVAEDLMHQGWDIGGSGAALRTLQCCVGDARCEMSCFDTMKVTKHITDTYIAFLHRPEFVYKFKFKLSGCANDCSNSMHRSDMPIIGTWRGPMQVDQAKVAEFIDTKGIENLIDNVLTRCPTKCLSIKGKELVVDNENCVRCMHCINVMHKALKPGKDRGATILLGGKRTLIVGDTMAFVLVPFMKLETDEDLDNLTDLIDRVWEFWNDNGMDHERIGEFVKRIGLGVFLDRLGIEPDPQMIKQTRSSCYIKFEELAPNKFDGEQKQNPSVWQREAEASESA
ncbi:MAG: dissimilatory-type sulfite reductase subunit alpha [Magnetococcus sp. DMHC-6]